MYVVIHLPTGDEAEADTAAAAHVAAITLLDDHGGGTAEVWAGPKKPKKVGAATLALGQSGATELRVWGVCSGRPEEIGGTDATLTPRGIA